MKPKKKYIFFVDPGHGWLGVPIADLYNLGIIDKITQYSYFNRFIRFAYLEEDCDAPLFIAAAKAAGWELEISEKHYDDRSEVPFIDGPHFSAPHVIAAL